jgi:hypothetical protein
VALGSRACCRSGDRHEHRKQGRRERASLELASELRQRFIGKPIGDANFLDPAAGAEEVDEDETVHGECQQYAEQSQPEVQHVRGIIGVGGAAAREGHAADDEGGSESQQVDGSQSSQDVRHVGSEIRERRADEKLRPARARPLCALCG